MKQFFPRKPKPILILFLTLTLPFLFGIAYFIGFNQKAQAAITFDNSSTSSTTGIGSVNWQHTTGNNASSILIVGITTVAVGSTLPTTVTYNGVALTRHASTNCTNNFICNVTLWYLINPPPGTHTISATTGNNVVITGGAASYYNINTSTPFADVTSAIGTSTSRSVSSSVSISGTTASDVVVDSFGAGSVCSSVGTITPATNQTQNWAAYTRSNSTCIISGGSRKTGLAGNIPMGWNLQRSNTDTLSWAIISARLTEPVVTPTPSPSLPPPTPTPLPSSGNIVDLNFGISNSAPWMQIGCGDVRMDDGVDNPLPVGQTMIALNSSCADPGIVFTGETTASFGSGQASSSDQIVGGSSYPETYTMTGGIYTSYNNLLAKALASDTQPIDLATICTLNDCTLPADLPHGVYWAKSSLNLNAFTFPIDQNYVVLVDGDLTFKGNVLTPAGNNSSVIFSTSGNIIVPDEVGSPAVSTTANLSGLFSADKSFIMEGNNDCADLRLNMEGAVIVNAALNGGSLQNNRDLCNANATSPTLQITQRLDYVLNIPEFVKDQVITSEETAP